MDSISKDNKISDADLENKNIEFLEQISVNDESTMETFSSQKKIYNDAIILLDKKFQNKIEKIQSGDDLLPGVLKVVKVFVAVKENYKLVIRWLDVMEIKVSFPKSFPLKICLS